MIATPGILAVVQALRIILLASLAVFLFWKRIASRDSVNCGIACRPASIFLVMQIAEKLLLEFFCHAHDQVNGCDRTMGEMSGSFPQNSPLQNFPAALRERMRVSC